MMKNKKRAVWLLACFLMAGFTTAQEKKESSRTPSGSKEEGNRAAKNLRNRYYYRKYRLCRKLFYSVGN